MNTTACLKRIPVPLDHPEVKTSDVVHVTLKTGKKYEVKKPQIRTEYLVGITNNQSVQIPLSDIQSMVIVRPQKKKVIWGIVIVFSAVLIFGLIFGPEIHISSVD